MSMYFCRWAVAALATFAVCGFATSPAGAAVASDQAMVEHSMSFRSVLGLQHDQAYVRSLLNSGDGVQEGIDRYGAVLTTAEQELVSQRQVLGDQAGQLRRRLLAEAPDFGGAYIDQKTGTVRLTFTKDVASNLARARTKFSTPDRLAAAKATTTLKTLRAQVAGLTRLIAPLRARGLNITRIAASERRNRLEIGVSSDLTTARRVIASVVNGASVTAAPPVSRTACVSRTNCYPPLRGGLLISPLAGQCTSSFIAQEPPAAGSTTPNYFLVTAGHCVEYPGEEFRHNNEPFGNGADNAFVNGSPLDAMLVSISPSNASNTLYTKATANPYPITSVQPLDSDVEDNLVCSSFAHGPDRYETSTCGYLHNVDMTVTDPDEITSVHQRGTDIQTLPGDSGAPVFRNFGVAIGIVSGYDPSIEGYDGQSGGMFYSHIGYLQPQLGASVLTAAPPTP